MLREKQCRKAYHAIGFKCIGFTWFTIFNPPVSNETIMPSTKLIINPETGTSKNAIWTIFNKKLSSYSTFDIGCESE